MNLRNLTFFEKGLLLYLTCWTKKKTKKKTGLKKKFDVIIKNLWVVQNLSFITRIVNVYLRQVVSSLKEISALYLAFCLLAFWDVQHETNPENLFSLVSLQEYFRKYYFTADIAMVKCSLLLPLA